MRSIALPLVVGLLLGAPDAVADPILVTLPLEVPVSIDLSADPVVTFGTRTIDFTGNLDQQFIAFTPVITRIDIDQGFRNTLAVRARDGLSALGGVFPPSPVPGFANQVPAFTAGTTDLLAFDVIIQGWGTPFSVSLTDRFGVIHDAMFINPVPEPSTLLLLVGALGLLVKRAITRTAAN